MRANEKTVVLGKEHGRRVAPEASAEVHKSNWMPDRHPGTSSAPYLLYPRSIGPADNLHVREVWASSQYQGRDFAPFEPGDVPNKHLLGQVLACGLKAACATYSQHWQGMYFDWTFNDECERAVSRFGTKPGDERFVRNAFATVVLVNTGYRGGFMDMIRLRRRPAPPSMASLEQIDMGTFEHNLKAAVGAVLGGGVGVNVIKMSLARQLVEGPNRQGYDDLKRLAMVPGMAVHGRITTVIQLGFKQPAHRVELDPWIMKLAGAKLIERKSERRGADFSHQVPFWVMIRFFRAFKNALRFYRVESVVKTIVVSGNDEEGRQPDPGADQPGPGGDPRGHPRGL